MKKLTFLAAALTVFSHLILAQNNSLDFDGSNDYVNICTNCASYGSSNITYEAWVFTKSAATQGILLRGASGNGYGVNFGLISDGSGNCNVWVGGNNSGSSSGWNNSFVGTVPLNTWTHVAATYNESSGNISVYINGAFVITVNHNFLINGSNYTTNVGKNQVSNIQYFHGAIDELRVWNYERSSSQIQAAWNSPIDCNTSGLIGCYHFDQGVAYGNNSGVTTLTNGASGMTNGTLNNFALTGTSSNWVPGATPLPIELISFTVKEDAGISHLFWRTASEIQNEGFEVQRSTDGINWQALAFIPGQGTTQIEQSYEWTDEFPMPGLNYYRLKQVDTDGQFEFSKVVSARINDVNSGEELRIYPNPANNFISVEMINGYIGEGSLTISNLAGEIVIRRRLGQREGRWKETIDVSQLERGIFFVELVSATQHWQGPLAIH